MDSVVRRPLMPGVCLTCVQTDRFHTARLGLHLITPLAEDTASAHALIPMLLAQGTEQYPDRRSLSVRLETLYGGMLSPSVRKCGDRQCIGFTGQFLAAPCGGGAPLTSDLITLAGDLLLRPATRNGRFPADRTEREACALSALIAGQKNDRASYAELRLLQETCGESPLGVPRLGNGLSRSQHNHLKLTRLWQELVQTSPIELFYCGPGDADEVSRQWRQALAGLPRGGTYEWVMSDLSLPRRDIRTVTESLPVSQCRLTVSFRAECPQEGFHYPALLVFNALLGGSPDSRLFRVVREERSLCYDIHSRLDRHSGLLLVSAGLNAADADPVREEILRQADSLARGDFSPEELNAARMWLCFLLRTTADDSGSLERFLFGQILSGLDFGPEELALLVSEVTAEQVQTAARTLRPDTVYILSDESDKQQGGSL